MGLFFTKYVMIYFIRNDQGHIKIGRTTDIDKRLATLQTGNSTELSIKYVIEVNEHASFEMEKLLHGMGVIYHIKGEWFKPEVVDHIKKHPWYKENVIPFEEWYAKCYP